MNDGGQAFPVPNLNESWMPGMTLRDWFAGMALQGLAVNQPALLADKQVLEHFGTAGIDKLQANKAYRLADAMLAERERAEGERAK